MDQSRAKLVKRAVESASNFNLFLNRMRLTERSVYIDLQTRTPNFPVGLGRQNKTLKKTNKIGRYPIAVLPTQFQDWFVKYAPGELKFLPVNTVMHGPIVSVEDMPPVLSSPDITDSESSCSSCSECSCSSDEFESSEPPILMEQDTNST